MAINRKYAYCKIMLGHLYRTVEDRFQSQSMLLKQQDDFINHFRHFFLFFKY